MEKRKPKNVPTRADTFIGLLLLSLLSLYSHILYHVISYHYYFPVVAATCIFSSSQHHVQGASGAASASRDCCKVATVYSITAAFCIGGISIICNQIDVITPYGISSPSNPVNLQRRRRDKERAGGFIVAAARTRRSGGHSHVIKEKKKEKKIPLRTHLINQSAVSGSQSVFAVKVI